MFCLFLVIVNFTVGCLVAWSLSGSEAGVDLMFDPSVNPPAPFSHVNHVVLVPTNCM